MIQKPFESWQPLGKVGLFPKGEYSPDEVYERLDFVYHNGSSWLALRDVPDGEPSETNPDWKILALGFPEVENTVLGVKGEAELEYRHGNVNITKENIGLDRVDNLSLQDIQASTVSSFSFNGHKQELKGDVDIPLVTGIVYNDKPLQHGNVHIHTIEGIAINGHKVEHGLIVTDMVTGIEINGRYKRGRVKLDLPEKIYLNGEELSNRKGRVNIDVVDSISINGRTPEKGSISLDAVESLTINGYEAMKGHVELDSVETLSINGGKPQRGHLDLETVHALSVNGKRYRHGYVDLKMVESISINGDKPRPGMIDLHYVEDITLNNRKLGPGKVSIDAVEGISYNQKPLKLDHGIAQMKGTESILLNGSEILDDDGTARIDAITQIAVNGELQKVWNGYVDLNIPEANGTVLYGVCDSKSEDPIKVVSGLEKDIKIEEGTLLFVDFSQTNHADNIAFKIEDTTYPVLLKDEPVTPNNARTFRKHGIFSFVFSSGIWHFHTGTFDPISYYDVTLYEDQWYEKDDMLLYDIEIPCLEDDIINVLPKLGSDPVTVLIMSQMGLYGYAQYDGMITLAAFEVPCGDYDIQISIE